ncbi:MAG: hypothetical protein OXE94_03985 [Aestuariivita sp.]|nr:hypothetical protein [Aestuariivita sp.]MCY4202589.1 hypothetical protein [Aestuariivita sp.]
MTNKSKSILQQAFLGRVGTDVAKLATKAVGDIQDSVKEFDGKSKISEKALNASKQIASAVDEVRDKAKEFDEKNKITEKTLETKEQITSAVAENTPEQVKLALEKISETSEVISGSKIMSDMTEALEIQRTFNDILASKLEEALNRISALEAILKRSDS